MKRNTHNDIISAVVPAGSTADFLIISFLFFCSFIVSGS